MDYLEKEFNDYKKALKDSKSFEDANALKAHAMQSLFLKIKDYLPKKSKILEVGFGSGYLLSILAKDHEVYGVEKSQFALKYAKAVFKEKKAVGNLKMGDGFKLNFPDNHFDFVFSIGSIEHYPKERQISFIKEMGRVSKKYVLISIPNGNPLSMYQKFKKTIEYYPETENLLDLKMLCKESKLKPIKIGGVHIIANKLIHDKSIELFYKKHGITLEKKNWEEKDLKKLMKIEKSFSEKTLLSRGFLAYVLAQKIKIF